MNLKSSSLRLSLVIALVIMPPHLNVSGVARIKDSKPKPLLVELDKSGSDYQRVLKGPPETVTMESGLVVLAPTKSVGKHSTKNYEEALIVLAGSGEMRITGGPTLKLKQNVVAYCPPSTEHDVVNTGSGPLRYLYLVAK